MTAAHDLYFVHSHQMFNCTTIKTTDSAIYATPFWEKPWHLKLRCDSASQLFSVRWSYSDSVTADLRQFLSLFLFPKMVRITLTGGRGGGGYVNSKTQWREHFQQPLGVCFPFCQPVSCPHYAVCSFSFGFQNKALQHAAVAKSPFSFCSTVQQFCFL